MALPTFAETRVSTWFERDRANVRLIHKGVPDNDLLDIWDDDVAQLLADGFLDPCDWHRSAYAYWLSLQTPEG